jgi:hypothetical protein
MPLRKWRRHPVPPGIREKTPGREKGGKKKEESEIKTTLSSFFFLVFPVDMYNIKVKML